MTLERHREERRDEAISMRRSPLSFRYFTDAVNTSGCSRLPSSADVR